jgi:hypothetical protein
LQLSMKARKNKLTVRRIGLCWEATRAPRWTRKPQAWAISIAQAGLLRVRSQSEKSTFKLTSTKTGIVSYTSTAKETFTLNQYKIWHDGYYPVVWTNKKYRMLYVNMGHNDIDYEHPTHKELSFTFENETQNQLILDGLLWLGGRTN